MGENSMADHVQRNFRRAFWLNAFRGLYDVIDADRKDASIRPNQIFAVSLPFSPLTLDEQRAVVEVVRRELLTPVGLRTLAQGNPGYRGTLHRPPIRPRRRLPQRHRLALAAGPFPRRLSAGKRKLKRIHRPMPPLAHAPDRKPKRRLHRPNCRDLRRRPAPPPRRLLRPGLERSGSAATGGEVGDVSSGPYWW